MNLGEDVSFVSNKHMLNCGCIVQTCLTDSVK